MSISFNDMYNITAGMNTAFTTPKIKRRTLTINHNQKKRDKMKFSFPVSKYEEWTRENFIIANLYVNFNRSSSSISSAMSELSAIDKEQVMGFKNEIIYYRKFLKEDLERIFSEEGNIDLEYMIEEYRTHKIKWFTFYFYLIGTGQDIEKISRSRINGILIKKIEKMLLYVTFSEKSIIEMRELINSRINI